MSDNDAEFNRAAGTHKSILGMYHHGRYAAICLYKKPPDGGLINMLLHEWTYRCMTRFVCCWKHSLSAAIVSIIKN
eukprot:768074-Hanusia_phi.AAC.5